MEENYYYFFSMNAYLSRADEHYIEARFLWKNMAIGGSCILFWMAIEQIIKLYIVQEKIDHKEIVTIEIKNGGKKGIVKYDPDEKDISKIFQIIDSIFYKIDSRHKIAELVKELIPYNINLDNFILPLMKINEYFERRYYKNTGTSISLAEINAIDEVYFMFRCKISEKVPRALIDEIAYQKKYQLIHSLSYFAYAYLDNISFKSRKHPVVNQMLPDGQILINDGFIDMIQE